MEKIYENNNKKVEFISSEDFLYVLEQQNSKEQIDANKLAAKRGLEILEEAFSKIKVGMSEKDVAKLVHEIFEKKPDYLQAEGVVSEEYSWEKENCPIVLIGENLTSGGHSSPSDKILQRGNTIYFDFGVKLTFSNGIVASSDLQRTGYMLKENETKAPKEIQEPFDTLIKAMDMGIEKMVPNIEGYKIDEIVRQYIIDNGYPTYNHGTGHPVKDVAHAIGTSLSPKGKRSSMLLQENAIYTVEPRIPIVNGCSVEEMIQVTKNGGVALCRRQKELYLLK